MNDEHSSKNMEEIMGKLENYTHVLLKPEMARMRALSKAIGYDDEDIHRPRIGIQNTWSGSARVFCRPAVCQSNLAATAAARSALAKTATGMIRPPEILWQWTLRPARSCIPSTALCCFPAATKTFRRICSPQRGSICLRSSSSAVRCRAVASSAGRSI